jgi:hypothetical protein
MASKHFYRLMKTFWSINFFFFCRSQMLNFLHFKHWENDQQPRSDFATTKLNQVMAMNLSLDCLFPPS